MVSFSRQQVESYEFTGGKPDEFHQKNVRRVKVTLILDRETERELYDYLSDYEDRRRDSDKMHEIQMNTLS